MPVRGRFGFHGVVGGDDVVVGRGGGPSQAPQLLLWTDGAHHRLGGGRRLQGEGEGSDVTGKPCLCRQPSKWVLLWSALFRVLSLKSICRMHATPNDDTLLE